MNILPEDYLRIYTDKTDRYEDPAVFARACDLLPDFRKKRVDTYKAEGAKLQSLAAFCLLIKGLEEAGEDMSDKSVWDRLGYETTDTGKPYFSKRPDIKFSLSHTKGAVMCVISGSEVGCDIERIDRGVDNMGVAKRVFTEEEQERCKNDPSEFFRIWTAREAHSKYTGEGLREMEERKPLITDDMHFLTKEEGNFVYTVCSRTDLSCLQ